MRSTLKFGEKKFILAGCDGILEVKAETNKGGLEF